MNKKALSLLLAGVLSASLAIPAFATGGGSTPSANGTDVLAGVMLHDPDAKIKVEVPTLFAFVVNGSVSTADMATGVTSADGDILLPNVTVKVVNPSAALPTDPPGTATYNIEVISDGVMEMKNFSTVADASTTSGREGLAVKVNGNISNEGDAISRNNWEHVGSLNSTKTTPVQSEFKKYTISLDGKPLSTLVNGGYELFVDATTDNRIELAAPTNIDTGTNLDGTTNLAVNGTVKAVAFGVAVGGAKAQYRQVEQSAKVGTIVWTVSAEVKEDVYTAPNNSYLDGVDSGANTDPDGIALTP